MKEDTKNILVLGATSAIAQQALRIWAGNRPNMVLVGRNKEKLQHVAEDLSVRGGNILKVIPADLNDFSIHDDIMTHVFSIFDGLDLVFIAHGLYGDQHKAKVNFESAREILRVNFLSIVSLLTPLSTHMEEQQYGHIAVVSSVAGDRGRQSNYVYGSAKAGLNSFLQGLRNRLSGSGVCVTTIKPGYVDTPMTAHMKKNFLFVSPDAAGRGIVKAVAKRKDEVYVPFFWYWIMLLIKAIPEAIFKRLRL